jgi:hypothetical protein
MKVHIWIGIAIIAFIFFGCQGKENTEVYSTPEGKVEVAQKEGKDHQEVTIKSKEGQATVKMGKGAVPSDLGVPLYPGAKADEGGTWSMSGSKGGKNESFSTTILHTDDSIDKVLSFYKNKLEDRDPEIFEMTTPEGKMVTITVDKDSPTSINIMLIKDTEKKGTTINISKVQK